MHLPHLRICSFTRTAWSLSRFCHELQADASPSPNDFKMILLSDSDPDQAVESDAEFTSNMAAFAASLDSFAAESKCL